MDKIVLFLLLIIIGLVLFYGVNRVINIIEVDDDIEDPDVLDQVNFNMDTDNVNRWNYGNKDFAPYLDGSYKQVTNNYVPGMRHYSFDDIKFDEDTSINNPRVNFWHNRNKSKFFFLQCK
jgi:hypothetical protein